MSLRNAVFATAIMYSAHHLVNDISRLPERMCDSAWRAVIQTGSNISKGLTYAVSQIQALGADTTVPAGSSDVDVMAEADVCPVPSLLDINDFPQVYGIEEAPTRADRTQTTVEQSTQFPPMQLAAALVVAASVVVALAVLGSWLEKLGQYASHQASVWRESQSAQAAQAEGLRLTKQRLARARWSIAAMYVKRSAQIKRLQSEIVQLDCEVHHWHDQCPGRGFAPPHLSTRSSTPCMQKCSYAGGPMLRAQSHDSHMSCQTFGEF